MAIAAVFFALSSPPDSAPEKGEGSRSGRVHRAYSSEQDADVHDLALARRIQSGDIEDARVALGLLYDAHRLSLWQFARQFTPSEDAAHDIVHDVFVTIWISRESWKVEGSVRAYLFGAVRNRAVDLLRLGARRRHLSAEVQILSTESQADVQIEAHEMESALLSAIEALPERQRTALLLFWHESMNMSEIARILEITPTASRKLLLSAQASLRKSVAKFF